MKFANDTNYLGRIIRSAGAGDLMYSAAVTRMRYQTNREGGLVPVLQDEADVAVVAVVADDPVAAPDARELASQQIYPRSGTDLIVLADVSPVSRSRTEGRCWISAGPYSLGFSVYGERIWERRYGVGQLCASTPAELERLPVDYTCAFGGTCEVDNGRLPFPENPAGKGFYVSADSASGRPLANIERHGTPRRWDERVDVVATTPYPRGWALRLSRCVVRDPVSGRSRIVRDPGFFDLAHPLLAGQRLSAGCRVILEGFNRGQRSAPGRTGFVLPVCPVLIDVTLGERNYVLAPSLEEVFVDLRREIVELTYRKLFHYTIRPTQVRRTVMRLHCGEEVALARSRP